MTTREAPGKFIVANGIRQHYLEYGSGDRHLVVCHGITGGGETWQQKAQIMARKYHLIVPDLRGHGYSDKPEWGYSLVDYSRDLVALMAALGLQRPTFMGHSMGARIALHLGVHHPESIGCAIAIDPPVSGPGRRRYPTTLEMFRARRKDLAARGAQAVLEGNPNYTQEEAAARARYGLMMTENAHLESWFGFHLEDIYPLVPQLKAPTLFLYADKGVILEEEAQELARLNPAMETVRIANSSHAIPWDNWPAFYQAVEGFLERMAATS